MNKKELAVQLAERNDKKIEEMKQGLLSLELMEEYYRSAVLKDTSNETQLALGKVQSEIQNMKRAITKTEEVSVFMKNYEQNDRQPAP